MLKKNTKVKKFLTNTSLSFIIVALSIFAILTCAKKQVIAQQVAKKTITLWHAYRADEKKALEEVAAVYNSSQNKITLNLLAVPYDAFPDKITAAVPQGKGPDLFIFAHDRVGDWAESKVIEPIDFWIDDTLKKRFFPQTITPLVYRKSLYGLPVAFKTPVLFYNKAIIQNPPTTTDELIATAKKFTNKAEKKYGLVYEYTKFYYHSAWLFGFGGSIFDAQGKLSLNSAGTASSLKFVQDLRNKHQIVPQEVTGALVTSLFNEGKAAMVINGPWFRAELKQGLNYGVANLPTISSTKKPSTPFMGSEGILMSAKSNNKEDAFTVMTYLTDTQSAKTRLHTGKQTVANINAYQGEVDPMIQVFKTQLDKSVPMPNTPSMFQVWSPADNAINKIVNGGSDATSTLSQTHAQIEQSIKSSRR